jgi:hypothetical protein
MIAVRDTKNRKGALLAFPSGAWRVFAMQAGER